MWHHATIEITRQDHSVIACSCHIYMGVVLLVHPVCGESHIQRNAKGEVATVPTGLRSCFEDSKFPFSTFTPRAQYLLLSRFLCQQDLSKMQGARFRLYHVSRCVREKALDSCGDRCGKSCPAKNRQNVFRGKHGNF